MVPEGWQMTRLGELILGGIKNGYSPVAADNDTGYWVLGLGALGESGLISDEIKPVKPTEKVRSCLLKEGDFLVSRSNTPDKVGRSLRFRGEVSNCSYPDLMMRFMVNQRIADPGFVEQKLKSYEIKNYFRRNAAGSSGTMVKINKSILEATPIAIPDLAEQKRIAQILFAWDEAISTTERLLANSDQQKKALMQQLLTGKKRLPGFEGDWKEVPLGAMFRERNEAGVSGLPLLSVTSEHGIINRDDVGRKDTSSADKSKYLRVCPGDIAYNTMRMWQGVSALSGLEGLVSPAYTVLEPRKNVSALYAAYLFKLPKMIHRFYRHSQGLVSDTWNLKYKHFSKIKVQLPELEEQEAVARVLSIEDAVINVIKGQITALKAEKKALMRQLLTGKRRICI